MSSNTSGFNMNRFRVSASTASTLKVFIPKDIPFQIHPDAAMQFKNCWLAIFEGKWYLMDVDIAECGLIFPHVNYFKGDLLLAIQEDGSLFFVPVTYPTCKENAGWRESLLQIANSAQTHWMTMKSNGCNKRFDGVRLKDQSIKPVWPKKSLSDLLELAFRHRMIEQDHSCLDGAYSRESLEVTIEE